MYLIATIGMLSFGMGVLLAHEWDSFENRFYRLYHFGADRTVDRIKTLVSRIITTGVPLLAGIIAVELEITWLIRVTLPYCIIHCIVGLFSGSLKFGVGLLLPIIPMLFISPWYKGLLAGFTLVYTSGLALSALFSFFRK